MIANKLFAIQADIGAAKNIVKNVCHLDESTFFPAHTDKRLQYLMDHLYPVKYNNWFACEYKLKQYTDYGIDMDLGDPRIGGLVPLNAQLESILETKNFMLDIMDMKTAEDLSKAPYAKILSVAPDTMFGLSWQVRAYTMKYGAERMFNFTFMDVDDIEKFKNKHGEKAWVKVNLMNFYDMVRLRRRLLRRSELTIMPMEWVITPEFWPKMLEYLDSYFGLTIPKDQALILLDRWLSLHWPTNETYNWEHSYAFKECRTIEDSDWFKLCDDI